MVFVKNKLTSDIGFMVLQYNFLVLWIFIRSKTTTGSKNERKPGEEKGCSMIIWDLGCQHWPDNIDGHKNSYDSYYYRGDFDKDFLLGTKMCPLQLS